MTTAIKMLPADEVLSLLEDRFPGARPYLEGAVEFVDVACTVAGYEKKKGTPTVTAAISTSSTDTGDTPSCDDCAVDCDRTIKAVQKYMQQSCGMVFDHCYAEKVAKAVDMRTIAEVKAFIGRTKVRLLATGVTGPGVDAEGDPTTFVATFPLAPGESILLRTEDWPLPYYVGCLHGILSFDGGNLEENYQQTIMQGFAGPKSGPVSAANPGYKWNDNEYIPGSDLRCGDQCTDVPLKGQDCGPSLVGELSEFRLVLTNKATASHDVTRQQLWIKLGYLKPYCCDECALTGKSCGGACRR